MNEMHRNLKVGVAKGILAKTNLNCCTVDKMILIKESSKKCSHHWKALLRHLPPSKSLTPWGVT